MSTCHPESYPTAYRAVMGEPFLLFVLMQIAFGCFYQGPEVAFPLTTATTTPVENLATPTTAVTTSNAAFTSS
jgi:hypothetical protein